jgi:hypothetical protein
MENLPHRLRSEEKVGTSFPNRSDQQALFIRNGICYSTYYAFCISTIILEIVCGNIFGDILSDEASLLVGTSGMNFGDMPINTQPF